MPAHTPFQHRITVSRDDIDDLGHVNNVVYIRWVQEVAEAHWLDVAPSELRQRYRWVVLRHEVDYRNAALPGDEITGSTWVGKHYGPRFDRFVTLSKSGGEKIFAEAKTTWCLLDARTMRPARIPDEVLVLL